MLLPLAGAFETMGALCGDALLAGNILIENIREYFEIDDLGLDTSIQRLVPSFLTPSFHDLMFLEQFGWSPELRREKLGQITKYCQQRIRNSVQPALVPSPREERMSHVALLRAPLKENCDCAVLKFWEGQRDLSRLREFAFAQLQMPVTSASSERVWSQAGLQFHPLRRRLTDDHMNAIMTVAANRSWVN